MSFGNSHAPKAIIIVNQVMPLLIELVYYFSSPSGRGTGNGVMIPGHFYISGTDLTSATLLVLVRATSQKV